MSLFLDKKREPVKLIDCERCGVKVEAHPLPFCGECLVAMCK